MIKRIILFLLIIIFDSVLICFAQTGNIPLSNPVSLEILSYNESRAKEFASKNLNRFAVERMQKYDYLLDSLYESEKNDTLAKIEKAYLTISGSRKTTIANLSQEIKELSAQKQIQETQYSSLVRKAILSFILWVSIVLVILQFRKRRLKKINAKIQSTNIQLQILEAFAKKAQLFSNEFIPLKELIKKVKNEFTNLNKLLFESGTNENIPVAWSEISATSNNLSLFIEKESKILNAGLAQIELDKEEKVTTDINNLCEQYLEIASRGIQKTDDFNCLITRDFEKKIAPIHINPSAIGSLLLNILTNAIQSVKEQNSKGIKGYQPKVAVSTRILPRFLQIRIKDNGTGIKETILKNVTNEFYSTRALEEGSGLGLYIANSIIGEMHKGEIKIESEEGTSTDVYIKFFI